MSSKAASLPDSVAESLTSLGLQIEVARTRRRMTKRQLQEAAMITSQTYGRLIKGEPGITLGVLGRVLHALNLEESLLAIADPAADKYGIALELARAKKSGKETDDDKLDTNF
ncbi:helix-turn-helix domain-containing protein [Marinobacter sp.]|uniref:helix-turn-helix domain-containing protein n=1 Tax=Marinobacter sp. TaxID=50741 RepID=UPI003A94BD88